MSIKSILSASIIATISSMATFSSFANLAITNHSSIKTFNVKCSGPMPGVPIDSGQTAQLDWSIIQYIIGGLKGGCSFYSIVNGSLEARADIEISPTLLTAKITNLTINDPNLHVTINPGSQIESKNISVIVTGG